MSATTLPPPTILLVDDDPTVRFLLNNIVRRNWPLVRVLEAENGARGLTLVQAHCKETQTPQSLLILLDLKMPVLDGFEFLHHFQHLPDHCKQATAVVVCSSSTNTRDLAKVQPLASGYLPKPLTVTSMQELLCQHLPAALAA